MNSVHLLGNIKGEVSNGESHISFFLEVENRVKKDDKWIDEPRKIPVLITGKRAEGLKKCDLGDGSRVAIEGQAAEGTKGCYILATDVVLCGRKKDGGSGSQPKPDQIPF